MSENSRPLRLLPAVSTVLALVVGCATVDSTTPKTAGGATPKIEIAVTTPKEDIEAGTERWEPQTADQRAWIENDCPREIMGPASWKRCTERNLLAVQAGLPDLTTLASADRAWIENDCPREIMGPASWKRCAERNLLAVQEELPELDAGGASRDSASASRVDHNDGRAPTVATRAEPQRIAEEITEPELTGHAAADMPPDPSRLGAPADGERWFCYTNPLSTLFDQSPEIVLTREGDTDQPFGKGRVLVADVIYDAIFQVEGIDRRWDWSDGMDSISVNPGGDSAYFNFRLLEPGETLLSPTQQLWCDQR